MVIRWFDCALSGAWTAANSAALSAMTAAISTNRRGRFLVTTPISLAKFDDPAHPAGPLVATLPRHASSARPPRAAQRRGREPPRMARGGPRRAGRDGQRRGDPAVDARAVSLQARGCRALVRADPDDASGRPPGGVRGDGGGERRRRARIDRPAREPGGSCDRRARLHGGAAGAGPRRGHAGRRVDHGVGVRRALDPAGGDPRGPAQRAVASRRRVGGVRAGGAAARVSPEPRRWAAGPGALCPAAPARGASAPRYFRLSSSEPAAPSAAKVCAIPPVWYRAAKAIRRKQPMRSRA